MVHQEIGAKDVVAILKRRYWLIILLAVFGGGAGFVAARILPKRFTSSDADPTATNRWTCGASGTLTCSPGCSRPPHSTASR